jgi:hypothetical protein
LNRCKYVNLSLVCETNNDESPKREGEFHVQQTGMLKDQGNYILYFIGVMRYAFQTGMLKDQGNYILYFIGVMRYAFGDWSYETL